MGDDSCCISMECDMRSCFQVPRCPAYSDKGVVWRKFFQNKSRGVCYDDLLGGVLPNWRVPDI